MIVRSLRPLSSQFSSARYLPLNTYTCLRRQSNEPPRPPNAFENKPPDPPGPGQPGQAKLSIESTLAATDPSQNNLLAPVHIPQDPNAVLKSSHPATGILAQSGLVVQRQIEMMNLFLGFEQANRYVIMDPQGQHVGYMAEHDGGFGKAIGRQMFRTHRSFVANIFDRQGNEVLRFHRPFSWMKSRIRVYDPLEPATLAYRSPSTELSPTGPLDPTAERRISPLPLSAMRIVGEAHSYWAPLRRKYELYLAHNPDPQHTQMASEPLPQDLSPAQRRHSDDNFVQFSYIDEPFLSWDFSLLGPDKRLIGSVNRNFAGFAREIFTDTGVYALRMDSAALQEEAERTHIVSKTGQGERAYADVVGGADDKTGMTLDQRAVMLATAVTVDFDYFSRHSHSGGMGFMPLWMGGGGGEAAGGAAGAGAVGVEGAGAAASAAGEAGGAVVGGAGRAVGGAAGAAGVGEGAMAGAGTLAGYEAMQRAAGRGEYAEQAPPPPPADAAPGQQGEIPGERDQAFNDPSMQEGGQFGQGQRNDVWGSGDSDPWSGGGEGGGGGGEGGGGDDMDDGLYI